MLLITSYLAYINIFKKLAKMLQEKCLYIRQILRYQKDAYTNKRCVQYAYTNIKRDLYFFHHNIFMR